MYRKNSLYCDRQVWAKSADPDQRAPEGESDKGLTVLQIRRGKRDNLGIISILFLKTYVVTHH